ncbi:MAG: RidA family protein [Methylobacteriaceae bacterium]|nr:RidA family protein [Methylobacteriaceae bacterium]
MTIAERLRELGHDLPAASKPVASYVSTRRAGELLVVSGQVSIAADGSAHAGRLGAELDVAAGRRAAEIATLNLLAQIAAATTGQVENVAAVLRLGVFVAATPDFTEQPQVANGASDLLVAVFGEAGRHARAAVGVASLPRGVAVEVDALLALRSRS